MRDLFFACTFFLSFACTSFLLFCMFFFLGGGGLSCDLKFSSRVETSVICDLSLLLPVRHTLELASVMCSLSLPPKRILLQPGLSLAMFHPNHDIYVMSIFCFLIIKVLTVNTFALFSEFVLQAYVLW